MNFQSAQIAVVIFAGFSDILAKPVRRCEFICCVDRVEFNLHKCKRSQITLKYIKLCGQTTVKRYEIACLSMRRPSIFWTRWS